ncbi:Lrp/AsnC family transcriptional regulator [Spongiactinospora sp. 9N601]|uniref:Lrp/AsnC family transcriptional regulator n=1 Tax=Spongiactinospora sp. 9N601 TaxID=3375149 RepID=UPI0037A5C741
MEPIRLDETDRAIIDVLYEDGRRPYGEVGKAVGLSEAATRQRVNRLRESGVIRISTIIDPIRVDHGVVALVGVRVDGSIRAVVPRLTDIEEVEYLVVTAGAFDMFLEVVAETHAEILDLVSERIRGVEGVRDTEIFMHLSIEKMVFSWGRRRRPLKPSGR